jgi:type I pantothenate kinase
VTAAPSPYLVLDRTAWARLRAATPMTIGEEDLPTLRGINERLTLDEVADVYLPLSRLLNLNVSASRSLAEVTDTFLGTPAGRVPYVVGIGGSVAVGKSTTARILQALLARWPHHPRVDLVATDGFLLPNRVLEERGIMHRKGFPESYDRRALLAFLAAVKSGQPEVAAPVYSHLAYDVVPGREQVVSSPDVLIVEGLNVLQTGMAGGGRQPRRFVSDYFDFSLYVDAAEADIERWYVERFLTFRETVFRDPSSYFRRYADLSPEEAVATARSIWTTVNAVNLHQNVAPTRDRARLVLGKGPDHAVTEVRLRRW